MELFRLMGRIAIDNGEAITALNNTSDTAEKTDSKYSNAMTKIGKVTKKASKTIITSIGSAIGSVVALGKKAVESYADYEQLVGGVETLFGAGGQSLEDYANSVGKSVEDATDEYEKLMLAQNKVFAYSKTAFKDAGMSANEYMETVTGFSASLIASLGGDTELAAEKANQALVDMSDNANKMGSDMESIKNAYGGFAKQNYTMLDNLKLGYGGTKAEMERLLADATAISNVEYDVESYADIVDAIHVIQTEMGITGTTSKEAAGTISGSLGMLGASWKNLLTGFADGNQDMSLLIADVWTSIDAVADNVIPRIAETMDGLGQFVIRAVPSLLRKIPPLLSQFLPQLLKTSMLLLQTVINTIIEGLPTLFDTILVAITPLFNNGITLLSNGMSKIFSDNFLECTSFLGMAINNLTINELLPSLQGLVGQFENLKTTFSNLYEVLAPIIDVIYERIVMSITTSIELISTVVIPVLSDLIGWGLQLFDIIMVNIKPAIDSICDTFSLLTNIITEATTDYIIPTLQMFVEMVESLWEENQDKINKIGELFQIVFNGIADIFNWFAGIVNDVLYPMFIGIVHSAQENLGNVKQVFQDVFNILGDVVDVFIALFKGDWSAMWQSISNVLKDMGTLITDIFYTLLSFFKSIWNKIVNAMRDGVTRVKDTLVDKFTAIKEKVTDIFKSMWESIKSTLNSIIGGVEGMVNSVVKAINKLIEGINVVVEGAGDLIGLDWSISTLSTVSLPRLENGGILEKGQVGLLEGNGAEAVVPLENNQKWIRAVADAMRNEINVNTNDDRVVTLLEKLVESNSELYDNIASLKFQVGNREFARLVKSV